MVFRRFYWGFSGTCTIFFGCHLFVTSCRKDIAFLEKRWGDGDESPLLLGVLWQWVRCPQCPLIYLWLLLFLSDYGELHPNKVYSSISVNWITEWTVTECFYHQPTNLKQKVGRSSRKNISNSLHGRGMMHKKQDTRSRSILEVSRRRKTSWRNSLWIYPPELNHIMVARLNGLVVYWKLQKDTNQVLGGTCL